MRDGRYIFDGRNRQTGLLYSTYGGFASLSGTAYFHSHFTHTQGNGLFSGFVAGNLSGKRCALFGPLKSVRTGGRPSNGIALIIRHRNNGVIERAIDMHYAEYRRLGIFLFPPLSLGNYISAKAKAGLFSPPFSKSLFSNLIPV